MKASLLIGLVFVSCYTGISQPIANTLIPKVDNRVELLTIVFRLAKAKDFSDDANPIYSKAIQEHFGKYSNHTLIKYVSHLKDSIEILDWDVPTLAVHLSQPPALDPLVKFNDTIPANIWGKDAAISLKLVRLLKQFYKEAKCHEFFESQKSYYESVSQQYQKLATKVNKSWFTDFFGLEPTEKHIAVIGLGMRNGTWLKINYPSSDPETYTIYRVKFFDANGLPTDFTNPIYSRLLIHEYIHAFTNTLVDKNKPELRSSAEVILNNPEVYRLMKDTFYGNWPFLLYESMVRGCAIKYLMANEGNKAAEEEIVKQEKLGFFWIRKLVKELHRYQSNRAAYKDLSAFMPELNKFFKQTAIEIKK
jgi:hypothetical protein